MWHLDYRIFQIIRSNHVVPVELMKYENGKQPLTSLLWLSFITPYFASHQWDCWCFSDAKPKRLIILYYLHRPTGEGFFFLLCSQSFCLPLFLISGQKLYTIYHFFIFFLFLSQRENRFSRGSEFDTLCWCSRLFRQSSDPQGQCLAAPQTPLPTYKHKSDEFKKLFKELPESERLIVGKSQKAASYDGVSP